MYYSYPWWIWQLLLCNIILLLLLAFISFLHQSTHLGPEDSSLFILFKLSLELKLATIISVTSQISQYKCLTLQMQYFCYFSAMPHIFLSSFFETFSHCKVILLHLLPFGPHAISFLLSYGLLNLVPLGLFFSLVFILQLDEFWDEKLTTLLISSIILMKISYLFFSQVIFLLPICKEFRSACSLP